MTRSTQLLGVSNAIVDILAHVDHDFLERIGAAPGSMTLIDEDRAAEIYAMMGPATEMSGGSVGNSVANFARLGGQAAYIGRVADDQFGGVFNHDMTSLGVEMRLPPQTRNAPTARSYVLITPDGQRTMQTYLGACTELAVTDINDDTVGRPAIVLIEGYLLDTPEGPEVVARVMSMAQAAGARIALSLS
ncbi:MAG: adenosine kinase, partial [Gammaproteobacteria bacterium]|nr:adenosine kinase [Gammaproteobacteria bacterium]